MTTQRDPGAQYLVFYENLNVRDDSIVSNRGLGVEVTEDSPVKTPGL